MATRSRADDPGSLSLVLDLVRNHRALTQPAIVAPIRIGSNRGGRTRLGVEGTCGQELRVDFPPSYVLAGSATACLAAGAEIRSWRYPRNGYQAEWEHVADVAEGRADHADSLSTAVSDLASAITIADQASVASLQEAS